jgi:hypothetical protein
MKQFEVEAGEYEAIANIIAADNSPVGIDAKKTHIIILHKLDELNKRLARIEELLQQNQSK